MKKRFICLVVLLSLLFTNFVFVPQATVKAAGDDAGVFFFENAASRYTLTYSTDTKELYQSVYSGDWDQQWEFRHLSDGYYSISPVGDYILALGIDGSVVNGASLKCGTNTGSDKQKWSISNIGGGAYVIRSKYDPNYVIEMTNSSSGSAARLWRYIEGENLQKWYRSDNNFLRNNINTVQNSATLKYLTASSSEVSEQNYTGSSSQKWKFAYSDGYYVISPMSNLSKSINASPYSNAAITFSSSPNNWVVCKLSSGKVKICSRVNPRYVITRKAQSNGTSIIVMEQFTGLNSQLWTLTGC